MTAPHDAVAVLIHHERDDAAKYANELIVWLTDNGYRAIAPPDDAATLGLPEVAVDESQLGSTARLAVCFGGDGTVLRAVNLVASGGVGVLGINIGSLGYLTEFEPPESIDAVRDALGGRFTETERMMVETYVVRSAPDPNAPSTGAAVENGPWSGLNEVALEKSDLGHTVRLAVAFDGEPFITYAADGLIISTPTGSTAYSLSAGGAIVEPAHPSLQLTPVAPHTLFDRSIMLRPQTEVRCTLIGDRRANLVVDGRNVTTLDDGDVAITRTSPVVARLITTNASSFHSVLKTKLGLRDR